MTREEIIKLAWEKTGVKPVFGKDGSKNGFADYNKTFLSSNDCNHHIFDVRFFNFVRPTTLRGIEDNNGWIKIESENDLPHKESHNHYMPCERGMPREDFIMKAEIIHKGYYAGYITHYRKIEKPKPPIY